MTDEPHSVITADDRNELARLLIGVPPALLAAVAGDLFQPARFPADLTWPDPAAVVDRIAAMPVDPDGVPPLLTFAAGVVAELSGDLAAEIGRWVDGVADATGTDRGVLRVPAAAASRFDAIPVPSGTPVVPEIGAKAENSPHNGPRQVSTSENSGVATVTSPSASAVLELTKAPEGGGSQLRIWGGVPLRNPVFTGRETLLLQLRDRLDQKSKATVLPHALHGMGGVGKTQLAVEFAYLYADRYDVVWWIPAEHQSLVLQSLVKLGRRLDVPETADLQQGANLVLERLTGSRLRWLLIYDNANEPEDISRLMPREGGHVILTSRNQTWSAVWDPVKVDTFDRPESIELVRKRSEGVSAHEADDLASRLRDLPLALDQAASCLAAAGMSVAEYLAELDQHVRELSKAGTPTHRTTITALVRLAVRRLRANAPAVAELLEMFAYLGAEPVSGGLLRRGREADVSPDLGRALRDQTAWNRAVRELRRYGLAKIGPDQRIQVHRLFQGVLRDELAEDAAQRARANVRHLLASANPGYPANKDTWPDHAEIGPHIGPAGLIDSELPGARGVMLDQVRYLFAIGDTEGALRLGEAAVGAWSKVEKTSGLGPDGALTLQAAIVLAGALRRRGFNERSRGTINDTYRRLRQSLRFGPDHEYTLSAADELAVNLRVAGEFRNALEVDQDNLTRHRRIFGDEDEETLTARGNLAVNLRMLSDFDSAHRIDAEVVTAWQQVVSENDNRLLFAQANLARDLYGLGRYSDALAILGKILPPYRQQLGARHPYVLLAGRTLAITLRKVGRYQEALAVAAEHHRDSESRYGSLHEHALAATMTLANTLRVTGALVEAHRLTSEALDRYRRTFGETHPLVLVAAVNHAILLRSLDEGAQARELDGRTYDLMRGVLGPQHGYTLCAAGNFANELALGGELEAARLLSAATFETSRRARGDRHPYTLACAVNTAIDEIAVGSGDEGQRLLDEAVAGLGEVLGVDHPETVAARDGKRAYSDIEPPPT